LTDGLGHPFGLDVNEGRVFWTDWDTKSVMSANKLTGKDTNVIIANSTDLMDIRVFHRTRRRIFNACGSDEENCPQKPSLCTSNEYKCADGTCIPKRWKCDKEQDCDGGEDENDCGSLGSEHPLTCGSDEFTCNNGRCILV